MTAAPKIYIAGPMTGYDDYNYPAFHDAFDHLNIIWGDRYTVVSPAHDDQGRPVQPPATDATLGYDHYLRTAIAKLIDCQAIYLLTGWQNSTGARLELKIAHALGMGILHQPGAAPTTSALDI